MEQRSEEWHKARLGRFTGSQISKLMGIKGLGKTGESYAFSKATEIVFGRNEDDNFESFDMKRGTELEPYAFKKIKEIKALEFIDIQECSFYTYKKNAGASPDGIIDKDGVLEIKCPKSETFFDIVLNGEKSIKKEYQWQMQCEMMVTNSKYALFFNYIIHNGEEMYHQIIVKRDEEKISLMKARIDEAALIRDEFVEILKKNKQF